MKTQTQETGKATATPLPWYLNGLCIYAKADESLVARIAGPRDDDPESAANARLIVEAVNQHATLKAASDALNVVAEAAAHVTLMHHNCVTAKARHGDDSEFRRLLAEKSHALCLALSTLNAIKSKV